MENIAYICLDEKRLTLTIVQSRNGRFRVLEEVENSYDLTGDILKDCLFSPKSKSDILKILNIYRYTIETYNASKMVATASHIIVKARNYRGFLDEIYTNTGMNFLIANDEDVVKNTYLSCMNRLDASKGYVVNLAPYCTYIMKFNRRNVVEYNVVPYGFRNLSDEDGSLEDKISLAKKELKKCTLLKGFDHDIVIGCGNSYIDVARLAKKLTRYSLDIDNNFNLEASNIKKVADFVENLEQQRFRKIKGLSLDGFDSLNGGLAIIMAINDVFKIKEVTVSTANMLEGLELSNLVGSAGDKYNDLLQNSMENIYEFRKEGLAINCQVYDMAVLLFRQLKVVHKLPRVFVKPLKIAAYMYDCGRFINFVNNEKLSYNVILNSEIYGVSQKDILLAALACSCQNIDNFNVAEVSKFKDILTDEDVDAIRKLGVLVRLAVTLNSSHKNVITDLICDILGDSIIMKTVVNGDAEFEIVQSLKNSEDFKRVFNKSLQII